MNLDLIQNRTENGEPILNWDRSRLAINEPEKQNERGNCRALLKNFDPNGLGLCRPRSYRPVAKYPFLARTW